MNKSFSLSHCLRQHIYTIKVIAKNLDSGCCIKSVSKTGDCVLKKNYLAEVICGHVGRNWGIKKTLCIIAESRKEAATLARWSPRVKHNHQNAVINVWEADVNEFTRQLMENKNDPYFICSNRREQYALCQGLNRIAMQDLSGNHYVKRGKSPVSQRAYELHYKAC